MSYEPAFDDAPDPEHHEPGKPCERLLDSAFGFDGEDWQRLAARAVGTAGPMGSLAGYTLIQELGRGGQGSVYKAIQPGTGRLVAIKRLGSAVLLGDRQSERFQERYRAEIEALTRLHHPCIVTVHAAEVLDGHPVLVMEFVEGTAIDRWADALWQSTDDPVTSTLACFLRVCEGVAHAHQRGVIHRDIKPTNIMVEQPTGAGGATVKVLDFGIARLLDGCQDSGLSTCSGFAGTPAYASPEQLAGRRRGLDTRSDVYSLGVLLSRLLSGREPCSPDASVGDVLSSIGERRLHRASRARPGLPRELDLIVLKATEVEAADRYQSVDALSEDVQRFLDGRPIAAHPPRRGYLLRKFVRRHRVACAIGVIAGLAIVSLAGVSSAQAWRLAARSRDLAEALQIQRKAADAIERARARAEAQEAIALEEGERQRRTSEFLLGLVENIARGSAGRSTIPIDQLAQWIDAPLAAVSGFVDRALLARLHLGLGTMYSAAARIDRAATHDRSAIDLLPGQEDTELRIRALVQLSSHQSYRGPASPALASAREALSAIEGTGLSGTPLEIEALRQVSVALARGGRRDEATMALHRALDIVGKTGQPAETRALVLADMAARHYGARDDDACGELADAAIASVPTEAQPSSEACRRAMVTRGMVAFRRGRLHDAQQCFTLASQWHLRALGDSHIRTRNAMRWHARSLHELGLYDQAAEIIERLLQLVPPSYEALDLGTWQTRFRYGATLLGQGRTEEAGRQLRLAITRGGSRTPGDPDAEIERVRACLVANSLRFSGQLQEQLGDLGWLVDQVSDHCGGGGDEPRGP